MPSDDDGFLERLASVPGVRNVISRADFDPDNPLHVDEAALPLLKHFLATDDEIAYELLAELSEPLLHEAAFAITREVGLAAAAESLVKAFFLGLMLDFRRNMPDTRHFLRRAERAMRRLARERVQELARGDLTPLSGGLVAHIQAVEDRDLSPAEREAVEQHKGLQIAFHGLEEMDRRLILLAHTDDLPAEVVADELGMDVLEVEQKADEAHDRLQHALDQTTPLPENEGGES